MTQSVKLLATATSVPHHVLRQSDVAATADKIFGDRYEEFGRMSRVFRTAGVRKRHAVRPIEWFSSPRSWTERTDVYLESAGDLFVECAQKALKAAELKADEVDTVVTVSSTGIATPSLEARVAQRVGLRSDVERVPVFGLGCAGGVTGFAIASRLAESRPGSNVLLVVVEICTLAFRPDELTKANIVATALFGDGAAACLLRAGAGGIARVGRGGQHTWPETLDIMGWNVDPEGFGVIFDRAIPPFAEENMGPAVARILGREELMLSDIDRFICHPGGLKVLDALEQSLSIEQGALDVERRVLSEFGNMSAPTVLFVLDAICRGGLPPRSALLAMGPGFSASCVSLAA